MSVSVSVHALAWTCVRMRGHAWETEEHHLVSNLFRTNFSRSGHRVSSLRPSQEIIPSPRGGQLPLAQKGFETCHSEWGTVIHYGESLRPIHVLPRWLHRVGAVLETGVTWLDPVCLVDTTIIFTSIVPMKGRRDQGQSIHAVKNTDDRSI